MFLKKINHQYNFWNIFFLISVLSHLFFWDFDYLFEYKVFNINIANPKNLLFLFFFSTLIFFPNSFLKNDKKILKKNQIIFLFLLITLLHLIINLDEKSLTIDKFVKLFFFFIVFLFCFNFHEMIRQNLKKIIHIFIIIFFIFFSVDIISKLLKIGSDDFFFIKYPIFKERSHFAMSFIPIFIYCILRIKKTFSFLTLLFLVAIFLSNFFFYSFTFLSGLIVSILFFMFFFLRNFKKKKLLILFVFISLILGSELRNYASKGINLRNDEKFIVLSELLFLYNSKTSEQIYIDTVKKKRILQREWSNEKILNIRDFFLNIGFINLPITPFIDKKNLTIEVFINSFKIAYYSNIDKKFLGNGLNNYESAFAKHLLDEIVPPYYEVYFLNYNDGSNNLAKILVEFGIFSLLFLYVFFKYVFNAQVPLTEKMFFTSLILTQLGRGAGYLNGGFIFSFAMMFSWLLINNKLFLFKKV
jgi:hypothetical protein